MSVEARLATPEDWPVWRELRLAALLESPSAFGSTHAYEAAFSESDWRSRLGPQPGVSVLATLDGRPAGTGAGYPDLPGWLHVVAMWTAPGARGRGVARAVLGRLADWASERELRLHLDVTLGNDGARAAYLRCGFEPTGETRPLREGTPYVVERMVLPRAAAP